MFTIFMCLKNKFKSSKLIYIKERTLIYLIRHIGKQYFGLIRYLKQPFGTLSNIIIFKIYEKI